MCSVFFWGEGGTERAKISEKLPRSTTTKNPFDPLGGKASGAHFILVSYCCPTGARARLEQTVHGDEVEGACDPGSARCESVCDFSHHAVNNILRILNF